MTNIGGHYVGTKDGAILNAKMLNVCFAGFEWFSALKKWKSNVGAGGQVLIFLAYKEVSFL